MPTYNQLASAEQVERTKLALEQHNITVHIVANGSAAKAKVFELLPANAEVMTMTSTTLDTIGVTADIEQSNTYHSVHKQLKGMNRATQNNEMQKLGAAPDYVLGSVHAVTEDGRIVVASQTGSQLPAYAYGSNHVIWVVGTQKIVPDMDTAMKRIYDYCLVLEGERALKAYGKAGSAVNKLLIVNNEVKKDRLTIILVNEVLGF